MRLDEVKRAMASREKVRYRDGTFYVTGCVMRIRDSAWYYQLELHELSAPSVTIADMNEVEVVRI